MFYFVNVIILPISHFQSPRPSEGRSWGWGEECDLSNYLAPVGITSNAVLGLEQSGFPAHDRGVLAFIEQDLATDTVYYPGEELHQTVLTKELRSKKRSLALGLRPVLREAGLSVMLRRLFLWTDDCYGAYACDLLRDCLPLHCRTAGLTNDA